MRLRVLLIAAVATLAPLSPAAADDAPKWGAHVDVGGWLGTKRNLGEIDLFVPLAQDARTLLFTDLRIHTDDDGGNEGNFGLGLRRMYASDWNLGAYAYYDRKRTEFGNYFNQATLGVEALGRDFDFRANAYLPFGELEKFVGATRGGSFASIVGTAVQVTTLGDTLSEERALKGFDAEIGWRVPVWPVEENKALRLYAGLFHFDDDIVDAVTGPRFRAELTMYEVPYLPEDSRLMLGAEFLDDNVRGSQGFATARLRIPLQPERNGSPLNWQERRMTDYVVRDVDIVTQTQTTTAPTIIETATQTANGSAITVIDATTTPGTDLATAVTNAGADSTVILQGSFNTTVAAVSDSVTLQTGQTVMGAGQLAVATQSGRTAVLALAPDATINATITGATGAAVYMGTNTLTGIAVNSSGVSLGASVYGVQVDAVSGAMITNNVISVTSAFNNALAVRLIGGSTNTLLSGNTIVATRTGVGGNAVALQMVGDSSATVTGNSFDATGGNQQYAVYRGGSVVLAGSTNNVLVHGICFIPAGTNIGSVGFSNAANCP